MIQQSIASDLFPRGLLDCFAAFEQGKTNQRVCLIWLRSISDRDECKQAMLLLTHPPGNDVLLIPLIYLTDASACERNSKFLSKQKTEETKTKSFQPDVEIGNKR